MLEVFVTGEVHSVPAAHALLSDVATAVVETSVLGVCLDFRGASGALTNLGTVKMAVVIGGFPTRGSHGTLGRAAAPETVTHGLLLPDGRLLGLQRWKSSSSPEKLPAVAPSNCQQPSAECRSFSTRVDPVFFTPLVTPFLKALQPGGCRVVLFSRIRPGMVTLSPAARKVMEITTGFHQFSKEPVRTACVLSHHEFDPALEELKTSWLCSFHRPRAHPYQVTEVR